MKIKSLAVKLVIIFFAATASIFIIVSSFNYRNARKIITQNARTEAEYIARCTAYQIESVMSPVMITSDNLSSLMSGERKAPQEIDRYLRDAVSSNKNIYGSSISFEPYGYDKSRLYYAPYYMKKDGKLSLIWLGGPDYQYFYFDWYQIPREMNRPVWSEPYFDEGAGNILMATYSAPFYDGSKDKKIKGVITADVSLHWLTEIISSVKILKTGYAVLISRNGSFVTNPDTSLIMNETIFSLAEKLKSPELRETGKKMIKGETGFTFLEKGLGKKYWVYYAPVPANGWSIALFFPQDELMAGVAKLSRDSWLLALLGISLLILVILALARSITKPITQMAKAAEIIGTGNFDAQLPDTASEDEIGQLSKTLNYMQHALKDYTRQLTDTTAAKQKIESELNIARDIQLSFLPKLFPPFPNNKNFDIYALIQSAREVGGDLYDFQLLDDEHVAFVIGDVTGKGVPASLFMAVTKTLFKVTATKNLRPEQILSEVNDELSEGNEKAMFVTAFFGILNIKTGEIVYSNGGHNMPLIVRADGTAKYLDLLEGMVVGVIKGIEYRQATLRLNPGDMLFLYTDGVTEADNPTHVLYGEARLEEDLQGVSDMPIKEIVHRELGRLMAYSKGDQSDDITMMVIKYYGPDNPREIEKTKNILR
ncbi:MAG: SpoIIE family protein phosphatase [Elusimicrobiaceae bacterium]